MGKYTTSEDNHLILPARVSMTQGRARELRSLGNPVPLAITIRFLIDTGSKRSTLIPGIIGHLQVGPAGTARFITSLGSVTSRLAWVSLEFPEAGLAPFPEVLVARLPMPAALSQFHGLLGRDLLRRFESFEYEGQRGCYSLRDGPGVLTWLRRWL
jgi:hypothetical protein